MGRTAKSEQGSEISKSDYIRRHPKLSASALISKGEKDGLSLSHSMIHQVRNPVARAGNSHTHVPPSADPWKSRRSGARRSASDFIRSFPDSTSVGEVVARGLREGLRFSERLVRKVRSQPSPLVRRPSPGHDGSPRHADSSSRTSASPAAISGSLGMELAMLVVRHGIDAVRAELGAIEARAALLLAGRATIPEVHRASSGEPNSTDSQG